MLVVFLVFIACVIVFTLVLFLIEMKETSKYDAVTADIKQFRNQQEEFKQLVNKNVQSIGSNVVLVKEFQTKMIDLETEVNNLQVYCTKLKGSQINLQDQLSKKRPVVQVRGLFPVEIETPAVRAPRKNQELSK